MHTARGLTTRPTSDRLRETLFNILAPYIEGSRFADICAGSGAVGIEALSRGAAHVAFIERSPLACSAIEENLKAVGVTAGFGLLRSDVIAALARLERSSQQFDIVFFDPPYSSDLYDRVLTRLESGGLLSEGATVVVEHRAKLALNAQYGNLLRFRELQQGESALSFYKS